ncbi:MAG TPA: alpha/beta hydrolase [Dongiaceae bacterium]|nr:alpha/beta hydrolase [Dongiaceae bacterium]
MVCLHGFPDNYLTFRHQVPALVRAGYRVLLPVLPGYESSSVDPDGNYQIVQLVRWLENWLDFLGEKKVHLVGHDWGAVVAWLAAVMIPERLHSITSIAIPSLRHLVKEAWRHPGQARKSWYIGFFQLPLLPERALTLGDGWLVRRLWRDWSPGWKAPDGQLYSVCHDLQQPGVAAAALGYYRCLFRLLDPDHRVGRSLLARKVDLPTLMICGGRDGCLDTRLFEPALMDTKDFSGGVELYRLMGAGHFCHLEKPALVNRKLLSFLQAHAPGPVRQAGELAGQLG